MNIQGRLKKIMRDLGLTIERRVPRPVYVDELRRYNYQKIYNNFDLKGCGNILDMGCGFDPFPHATHIVDISLKTMEPPHARDKDKAYLIADIHHLPFPDKSFDFIYCSHVLEHSNDPLKACREIMRAGKRGYIETPTLAKDGLFCWARGQHKWHVISISNILCFFEYTERQLDGISSSAWYDLIQKDEYHPLQEAYYNNLDFFNTMFSWENDFRVFVFSMDGSVKTSDDD